MNIIYSASRNLYPYLRWSIRSLLDHNRVGMIYVLAEDDGLPFKIPCRHRIINMTGQRYFGADCPNIRTQFTPMAMLRVCTPELIKAEKVIQLDVDTIICDSLEPLWNTDLTGKWIGWCPELRGIYRPYGPMYYNFGVAVLNLRQMRKDMATVQMVNMLNSEYLRFVDQDAMNILALPDKSVDIDIRFNESFCCGYTENPAIVHFAGYPDWYENRSMFRWEYLARYQEQ